jgi:hypothetical protein
VADELLGVLTGDWALSFDADDPPSRLPPTDVEVFGGVPFDVPPVAPVGVVELGVAPAPLSVPETPDGAAPGTAVEPGALPGLDAQPDRSSVRLRAGAVASLPHAVTSVSPANATTAVQRRAERCDMPA